MSESTKRTDTQRKLTERQIEIFDFMVLFTIENFYQPSIQEVCTQFGFRSFNAVVSHLDFLQWHGLVSHFAGRRRAIEFHRRTPIKNQDAATKGGKIEVKPKKELTFRQAQIFNWMVDFTVKNFYQPSLEEIGQTFGMTQRNAPISQLKALENKGLILLNRGKARAITFRRRTPIAISPPRLDHGAMNR